LKYSTPPIAIELQSEGRFGTIVPIGTAAPGAGVAWAAAEAAAAFAAAAFAAAAFAAAALVAAALVTAAVVATAAPLYIERRATPATDMGVRGIPMMASVLSTNPKLNNDMKNTATVKTIVVNEVFINSLLFIWISHRGGAENAELVKNS
jgi:hypothetical protein